MSRSNITELVKELMTVAVRAHGNGMPYCDVEAALSETLRGIKQGRLYTPGMFVEVEADHVVCADRQREGA